MWRDMSRMLLCCGVLLLIGLPAAGADIVALKDGRIIEGRVEETDGACELHLAHGSIIIPFAKVKMVFKTGEKKDDRKIVNEKAQIEKEIEAMRVHSEWRNAYEDETKHFMFRYNVTPEIAQVFQDMLEDFYQGFRKEFGVRPRSLSTSLRHFSSAFNVEPPRQHDQVDRVGCAHRAQRHGRRPSRVAG